MAITRWDPMHEMREMTRRMERMFEPAHNVAMEPFAGLNVRGEYWPAVDVYEDKDEILLRAELPGLERKHVELLVENSTITIRGERKLEKEEKRENYHRIECTYGAFARSFVMPTNIDVEKIRAEMREGVLFVHVPKREGAKGRAITIGG